MTSKHRFASFWLAASVLMPAAALAQGAAPAPAPADPGVALSATVGPFLQKNCFACHSSTVATGGVDIQGALGAPNSLITWRETWEAVALALEQGQMPPPNMPRPAKADVDATVHGDQDRAGRQSAARPQGGADRTHHHQGLADLRL